MKVAMMFWGSLWRSLLSWSPSSAVRKAWAIYQRSPALLPRREWLMRLGLAPLGGLLISALEGLLIYALSYSGLLVVVAQQGLGEQPADWVFWSASAGLPNVMAQVLVTLILVSLIRIPYLVSGVAWIFAFPGFISILGFAAVLLAERWALRTMLILRDPAIRLSGQREWWICWAMQGLSFVGLLSLGLWIKEQGVLWIEPMSEFHPDFRYAVGYFLLVLFVALEVILNMIVLHFDYNRHGET